MRKKHHTEGSLQKKLLVYMLLIAFLPAACLLFWYFNYMRSFTVMQLERDNSRMLSHAVDKLDVLAEQVNEFVLWIDQNADIDALLSRTSDTLQYDETVHRAMEQLREQVYYRPIAQQLSALYILGSNGLDLRCGSDASLIEPQQLGQVYDSLQSGQNWGYAISVPSTLAAEQTVVFYTNALVDQNDGENYGCIILLFSVDMLREELEPLLTDATTSLTLCNRNGETLFQYENIEDQPSMLYLKEESRHTQWKAELQLSAAGISEQLRVAVLSVVTFIIILLVLIILLAAYLSHNLAAPVERIAEHVSRIAKGDFSQSVSIEGDSEISRLGRDIDQMRGDIQRLIQERDEKQRLEMRLLQNQMNPHFLYNTLSSIKLMAGLQGKNSVAETIEALGKLLRANLSGSRQLISLEEEIKLLESYIYIQNIRLKDTIDYQVEVPDELQTMLVPKFVLQPLAENAILYGIEGRPEGGTIQVRVQRDQQGLAISVCDDGKGIEPDRLSAMQKELDAATPGQAFAREKGIGLYNVVCRLRLQWGSACRLQLTARQPGLCVTLYFPAVEDEQ